MTDNKQRKTFGFTAGRNKYQSGWTSDKRRYSTVPPETIISSTSFKFKKHNFDTQPGTYYASHVEAQALYNVQEGTPILVSRKVCEECEKFVKHLAKEKKLTHHVGTPDAIKVFSEKGVVSKTDSAQGTTRSGVVWSMRHQGGQTTMHLQHPNGKISDCSVLPDTEKGPYATETHTHFDGIVEKATYFQSKETLIETSFPTGKAADTRVGPSNGVRDSEGDDKWKRVPKRLLL